MPLLIDFDYRLFKLFNSLAGKSELWDFLFVFFADYVLFFMIAGLALFIFGKTEKQKRYRIALQSLAAAFIGRALIVSLIRAFFFRPRPFVAGIVTQLISHNPLEGSFPSGHATVMFALSFALFYQNKWWGVVYFIFALASSLARIVAGIHFPLDIIGGLLVAAFSAIIAKNLFELISADASKRGTKDA